jgi:hypothetical protein
MMKVPPIHVRQWTADDYKARANEWTITFGGLLTETEERITLAELAKRQEKWERRKSRRKPR